MSHFKKIRDEFVKKFKDPKISEGYNLYCCCYVCPHNDKSLCPERCVTKGGHENDCLHPPCQIRLQDPAECEKQKKRIAGKPMHVMRKDTPAVREVIPENNE
jgi:hypothetical protein